MNRRHFLAASSAASLGALTSKTIAGQAGQRDEAVGGERGVSGALRAASAGDGPGAEAASGPPHSRQSSPNSSAGCGVRTEPLPHSIALAAQ